MASTEDQTSTNRLLGASAYDLSTYTGRLRHFLNITSPRTLFSSENQLQKARSLISQVSETGVLPSHVSINDYWKAKTLYDATYHPDTKEKVFLPFRMSSFVPTNLLVTAGMLLPNPSTYSILFWQWANQSVNVAINYANANKTSPMSMSETISAYTVAVATSCSIALGLTRPSIQVKLPKPVSRLVPFCAVAVAGTANVFLMRQKELREGISVKDDEGNEVGKSKKAGLKAVSQVAVSRVATAFPCLAIPPWVMSRLEKTSLLQRHPKLWQPIHLGVIAGCLMFALPCAIALFPQESKVPVEELESTFSDLKTKDGKPITQLNYNKGL